MINSLYKEKALYVKACVIVNNTPDKEGDVLNSIDIKKIFTSYNNQDRFEIHHNNLPLESVSLLENYISTNDEIIAEKTIPTGSWNVVIRVDNPEIQQMILKGDFNGISLYNRVKTQCSNGLTGDIKYSDIGDAECIIPLFISFVKEPANNIGLHIFDYDTYIKKSRKRDEKMSFLEKIKALIAEEEAEEAPTIVKEASSVDESSEDDEPVIVKENKEEKKEDKPEVTKEDTKEEVEETKTESEDTDADLKEEVQNLKDEISKINEEIAKLKENKKEEDNQEEKVEEPPEPEKPVITKSSKITVTNDEQCSTKNFYEMTGRDPITGKRIRDKSKILN